MTTTESAELPRRGVHRRPVGTLSTLLETAGRRGVEVHRVGPAADRSDVHDRMARSWSFPAWYGRNLDALADCLADLSWRAAAPRVLLIGPLDSLRAADPVFTEGLCEVLDAAQQRWSHTDTPLAVVELTAD